MPDSDRERLLAEYDALEDAIETSALDATWALGDWLVEHVPNPGVGRRRTADGRDHSAVRTSDLAGRRGRSAYWLNLMRKTAEATASDRVPDIVPWCRRTASSTSRRSPG